MRLKQLSGAEGKMDTSIRPTVKPRTIITGGAQTGVENSRNLETLPQIEIPPPPPVPNFTNNSQVPFIPVPRKPRPKPRLTPTIEANEEDETPLPACFFEPQAPKDPKRLTVNIFKRTMQNPFDVDFEESMKDAALMTVESEDSSPDQESTFFPNPVESDSQRESGDEIAAVYDNVPIRHDRRLQKMNSCPEASTTEPSGPSAPHNRSLHITDSIYEAITSYSSSESGLSDSNSESPGWAKFPRNKPIGGTEVLNKRVSGGATPNDAFSSQPPSNETRSNSRSSPFAQSTNTDSIVKPTKTVETNRLSNRISDGDPNFKRHSSGTRSPFKLESKPKVHEYDEVAVEDGLVNIRRPHSINTSVISEDPPINRAKGDGTSLPVRNSVVMEFDPLCQQTIYNYEDIDEDDNVMTSGNPSISTMDSNDVFLSQRSEIENPEYFPGNIKEMSPEKKLSGGFPKVSDVEEEYEPVTPVPPARPLSSSRDSVEFPLSKDEPRTGSTEDVTARSSQKSPESSESRNFLRRLSNKLLPPKLNSIPENQKKLTESVSSALFKCPVCFEEHPENTGCKFSPTPRENVNYSSVVFKASGLSKRDFVKRFAVLSKGKLTFSIPTKPDKITDTVILQKVVMISKKDDHRVSQSPHDLKCFQLYLGNGKSSTVILAGGSEKDRSIWMQKLIEAFTYSFPSNIISSYDRAGWVFVKENLTGKWIPSWFVLSERKLYYAFNNAEDNYQLDLRKVREVSLSSKGEKCPSVDNNDILTLHAITKILYVQAENVKVTATWQKAIRSAVLFNGVHFEEMQLTNDNVPVVVEKCIDFLCPHGTMSEGIYRQSGANSRIAGLLEAFKKDAWSVQICPADYSAHDVAGTLKRFFRTLPEPLVTDLLYDRWISAFGLKTRLEKMEEYIKLLNELPQINYNILRKLVSHLHMVHEMRDKNLMPLDNLAPIWGPTLMSVDDNSENTSKLAQSYEIACAQCGVVRDLIENYHALFRVDPQEIEKERRILDGLGKFHVDNVMRKPSGDMRFFVHLHERDDNRAIHVILTPTATAQSIVEHIVRIRGGDNLSLHEVILGKRLERPLYPSEKVVDTILRWSIWDGEENKSNYLVLKKNTLYPALLPFTKDSSYVQGEFKYADSKSKSFRKYAFEFSGAKLKCFKDAKTSNELESWKIEDIIWYIGHDVKRTPPTRFNFTFIPRKYDFKRSKDEPYFGNVVSVNTDEELHKFIAAMIVGEHPEGLYPSVIL